MIKKHTDTEGITLVALVITIIILLIVSGITIMTLTGNNGIISRGMQASEESKYGIAEEKVKLAVNSSYGNDGKLNENLLKENVNKIEGIEEQISEIKYPLIAKVDGYEFLITEVGNVSCKEKTEDEIGKEVALKDGWGTETVTTVKTADGSEVTGLAKVSTVYAVSVGNGETVPIPKEFYYVGGNLNTGVIISDKEEDKYDGKIDKTTWEYTTQLKGNQFVWIPSTPSEYHKTDWGMQNSNWEMSTEAAELPQIQKYGGFYVARYEAGLPNTISEFTTTQVFGGSSTSNQIYNEDGKPQSKAGQIPWMYIDWTHSKANSEIMYNNDYVYSGLITGTQWDVILNRLVDKTSLTIDDLKSSSKWGNHNNTSIPYKGRLSKAAYVSKTWHIPAFGDITEGTTGTYSDTTYGDLLTTGASSKTEQYHIYDIAGNLWEWTEEVSTIQTTGQYHIFRGGSYINSYSTYPAYYRYAHSSYTSSKTSPSVGFRTVLYIK